MSNRISGIYKIQSISHPNRCYIGSSINIYKRWNHHITDLKNNNHHSIKMQRHFEKYGISDLQFSIILGCDTIDVVCIEQYFLDSYKPYFNSCFIAGNCIGLRHSEESYRKQAAKMRGKKHTEESKRKMSEVFKGRSKSESHKKKLSVAFKGLKKPPRSKEYCKNISESKKGSQNGMFGKIPWNKKLETCQN